MMKLKFHPEVKDDINNLDGSVKPRLKSTLNKIKKSPELGKPLGNKRKISR
ncbi:hypothetical protein [Halanaerobium saccharolyticum]|nr:hypothetical protein [Halanaerobium saccharolyticum]